MRKSCMYGICAGGRPVTGVPTATGGVHQTAQWRGVVAGSNRLLTHSLT